MCSQQYVTYANNDRSSGNLIINKKVNCSKNDKNTHWLKTFQRHGIFCLHMKQTWSYMTAEMLHAVK